MCNIQNERRFNSQLYDLRNRLEQSHCTNRSLQSYIEFLKNSYTAVFSDTIAGLPTANQRSACGESTTRTLYQWYNGGWVEWVVMGNVCWRSVVVSALALFSEVNRHWAWFGKEKWGSNLPPSPSPCSAVNYKLPINVPNFMQKDSAQAKISSKVVGGYFFWLTLYMCNSSRVSV